MITTKIELTDDEFKAVVKMAEEERRTAHSQMAWLIVDALRQHGRLPAHSTVECAAVESPNEDEIFRDFIDNLNRLGLPARTLSILLRKYDSYVDVKTKSVNQSSTDDFWMFEARGRPMTFRLWAKHQWTTHGRELMGLRNFGETSRKALIDALKATHTQST